METYDTVKDAISQGYVLGLQSGKIEPRLEIDEFILDKDVLNLFLLAIIELQSKDYTDSWSWFQIAGIHGRPFSSWDNVQASKINAVGYCAHSSVTFPTWHRPYVAMMEQAVYSEMVKKALKYSDETTRKSYLEACSRFRFPYWDPCIPRQLEEIPLSDSNHSSNLPHEFGIPKIVSSPKVFVRHPETPGELSEVHNPLYQYNFPGEFHYPNNPDSFWQHPSSNALIEDSSLEGTYHTVRAPNENGVQDDGYINMYMQHHIQTDIGGSLYKVLTAPQRWITFSNDVYDEEEAQRSQDKKSYIDHTLEGFHDNIHVFLGQGKLGLGRREKGSGHIGDPNYAAFDPLFWLHHCNVDRITALWQAQHSSKATDSWWTESAAGEGNWSVVRGTIQKPSDGLVPFRKPPNDDSSEPFWSSDGVHDWTTLGYTYQGKYVIRGSSGQNELATFDILPENADTKKINSFVNQFYSWMDLPTSSYPPLIAQFYPVDISQVEALSGSDGPGRPGELPSHPERIAKGELPNTDEIEYDFISDDLIKDGKLRQWDLHIRAEKFKLNKSYQILVFLGPFKANEPDGWPTEPNLVGIDGIFSNDSSSGGCSNCEEQAEAKLTVMDVIPLTRHLVKWIKLRKECPPGEDDAVTIENLEHEQVERFLKKNLHWRVADMNLHPFTGECNFVKVSAVDRVVRLPQRYDEAVRFGEEEDDHEKHQVQDDTNGQEETNNYGHEEETNKSGWCCGFRCSVM